MSNQLLKRLLPLLCSRLHCMINDRTWELWMLDEATWTGREMFNLQKEDSTSSHLEDFPSTSTWIFLFYDEFMQKVITLQRLPFLHLYTHTHTHTGVPVVKHYLPFENLIMSLKCTPTIVRNQMVHKFLFSAPSEHLIHWGTTHLSTSSITAAGCYSVHQRRSRLQHTTSKLFQTLYGYASWSICTETGLFSACNIVSVRGFC